MRNILVALLAVLALSGCGAYMLAAPPLYHWEAEVYGMRVLYRVVDQHVYHGVAFWDGRACRVALSINAFKTQRHLIRAAAHEIAHCMDWVYLGWSHGGLTEEGCTFTAYYCQPEERFAESYRHAYEATCGLATGPLGLIPDDGVACDLPDPRRFLLPGATTRAGPSF